VPAPEAPTDRKGKAKVVEAEEAAKPVTEVPLVLLLRLLSQPLYVRSNSHLEQVRNWAMEGSVVVGKVVWRLIFLGA
jgi:hypothetical protein